MTTRIPTKDLQTWTRIDLVGEDPEFEELILLDTSEVAAVLRVHPTTVKQMVRRGDIHPAPVPIGRVLFTKAEVRRIIGLEEAR